MQTTPKVDDMQIPMVIYHRDCNDGLGAALAVWRKYKGDVELHPVNYGDPLPDVTDRVVYIVDFSFPKDVMSELFERAAFTTWYDHHLTVFKDWDLPTDEQTRRTEENATIVLDPNRSGARIAWEEIFHYCPTGIDYIDDRDRWQFKLPLTKAFHHGLKAALGSTIEKEKLGELWNIISNDETLFEVISDGAAVIEVINGQVKSAVERDLKKVSILGHEGLAANIVNNISETGNAIAEKSGTYSLTFFIKGNDAICSLRSIGAYDVSMLAKHFGGGGHRNASGFKLPIERFFSEVWK